MKELIDEIISSKINSNYITNIIDKAYNIASIDFSQKKMIASINKIIN